MLVWKVKPYKCGYCVFEHFSSALEDYMSHDNAWIYPAFMSKKKFNLLPEFNGW